MSITEDRYIGTYEGHSIELFRNNWDKTLRLLIDGKEVDRKSRVLPRNITLSGAFEHNGIRHTVTARSIPRLPSSIDTVEVDGVPLPLTKVK